MTRSWYEETYRRILLDMHIHDWDPRFLSQVDPSSLATNVVTANARTVTIPANAHTGLCYWPSSVGRMHNGIHGQNLLSQMIEACHRRGLNVIIYYCTIYVDWYWEQHPEARIVDITGKSEKVYIESPGHPHRFSVCCLNNPDYRQFVVTQLTELCRDYPCKGITLDMTWWPGVCYCATCRQRYDQEIGGEMPSIVDWCDPAWVTFQRKREEWLVEFVHLLTTTIRTLRPEITITHQSQPYVHDWVCAATPELAAEVDWLSGDLYRDRESLSVSLKLVRGLSQKLPFEQINSWCYPNIFEHVVTRTDEHLAITAYVPLMNNGAAVFIDAIDPLGTLDTRTYARVGSIYADVERYEPYLGGTPCQDIAIYLSFTSSIDLADNGMAVADVGYTFAPHRKLVGPETHRPAVLSAAKTLLYRHWPFGIITKKDLAQLSQYQILVLPNVAMLDDQEVTAIREYVRSGGSLYASKDTSLVTADGHRQANFLLADLFGVDYQGETNEIVTYIAPSAASSVLFAPFTPQRPLTITARQTRITARPDCQVLGTLILPYSDPRGTRYASILTNPPGIPTSETALTVHTFGKGKVIYAAGPLEIGDHDSQRAIFASLLQLLANRPFSFEAEAPKAVEITMFRQDGRDVINLLNFQLEQPNIPVHGIHLRLRLDQRQPHRVVVLPSEVPVAYAIQNDSLIINVPELQTFMMLAVDYRPS